MVDAPDDVVEARAAAIQQEIYQRQEAARRRVSAGFRTLTTSHFAIVASATFTLVVALRLLAAGRGDPTTAIALAQAVSGLTTIIPLIYTTIGAVSPVLIYWTMSKVSEPSSLRPEWAQGRWSRYFYVGAATVPAAYFASWRLTLIAIVMSLTLLWSIPAQRRANTETIMDAAAGKRGARFRLATLRADMRPLAVFFIVIVLSALIVANDQVWLPAERAAVRGNQATFYVLEEREDSLLIMFDDNREVKRLDIEEVGRRQLCSGSASQPSLFGLLWERPSYPRCP